MADIVLQNAFTNGTVLDTDLFNRDVYSDTGTEGVLSEPNGRLNNTNLATNWRVRAEHVQPEQVVRVRQNPSRNAFDFYSEISPEQSGDEYFQLGDCSLKIRLPHSYSLVLWQWQMYISAWKPEQISGNDTSIPMVLQTSIDGTLRAATERVLPNTALIDRVSPPDYWTQERLAAQWFCMADCSVDLAAGMHEISVRAFMRDSFDLLSQMRRAVNATNPTAGYPHRIFQRLTMGIHNVAAVCFL